MATNIFEGLTARGVNAQFRNAMETAPTVWENHVQRVASTEPDEQYAWLGMLPVPREHVGARQFQGMIDFTFNLKNKAYELSFLIDRDSVEDQKGGQINSRIGEAAQSWAALKLSLFATLLTDNGNAFDGTAFYSDTRVIGKSANVDNNTTSAAATGTQPTSAEVLGVLETIIAALREFQDDQGRPAYNATAANRIRAILPADYERPFSEAVNSTVVPFTGVSGAVAGVDNPWGKGLIELDFLPYLTANDTFYLNAIGSAVRMPFIYQERNALEIQVLNDAENVALHNGVMVLARQRFRFGYGEPRRSIRHTFT